MIKGFHEHVAIFWDDPHPLGDDGPTVIDAIMDCSSHLIFTRVSGHLKLSRHGE